jgi:hypothetical protein
MLTDQASVDTAVIGIKSAHDLLDAIRNGKPLPESSIAQSHRAGIRLEEANGQYGLSIPPEVFCDAAKSGEFIFIINQDYDGNLMPDLNPNGITHATDEVSSTLIDLYHSTHGLTSIVTGRTLGEINRALNNGHEHQDGLSLPSLTEYGVRYARAQDQKGIYIYDPADEIIKNALGFITDTDVQDGIRNRVLEGLGQSADESAIKIWSRPIRFVIQYQQTDPEKVALFASKVSDEVHNAMREYKLPENVQSSIVCLQYLKGHDNQCTGMHVDVIPKSLTAKGPFLSKILETAVDLIAQKASRSGHKPQIISIYSGDSPKSDKSAMDHNADMQNPLSVVGQIMAKTGGRFLPINVGVGTGFASNLSTTQIRLGEPLDNQRFLHRLAESMHGKTPRFVTKGSVPYDIDISRRLREARPK